jgi:SpoIID/LytB domain protein
MKKKNKYIIIFVAVIMLLSSYLGVMGIALGEELTYKEPTYKEPINVGITSATNVYTTPNQTIILSKEYSLLENNKILLLPGSYQISVAGSNVSISQNGIALFTSLNKLSLFPVVYSLESTILINSLNRHYLGTMIFNSNKMVSKLPLEHYLYGVVPHEIGESSHAESQKVQAVAARSYGAKRLTMTLQDNTSHQVYRGFNPLNVRSIAAVNATRGQIMRNSTEIVDTFFSSSNGGNTLSVWNSWNKNGTQKDYFRYKEDTFDTAHKWNFNLLKTQIDLSLIDELNPLSWWSTTKEIEQLSPQIIGLKAYMKGKKNVPLSTEFKIYDIEKIYFTTPENTMINSDTLLIGDITIHFMYLDANNKLVKDVFTHSERTYNFYSSQIFGTMTVGTYKFSSIRSPNVKSAKLVNGVHTISGAGWGHGIGMSQNGAMARATAGQSYLQILSFYYDGVTISPINNSEVFINNNIINIIPTPIPVPVPVVEYDIHTVVSGETLSKIAALYNTTYQNLGLINNIAYPYSISIGQKLNVPKLVSAPEPIPVPVIEYVTLTQISGTYNDTSALNRITILQPGGKYQIIQKGTDGWNKLKTATGDFWVKDGINTYSKYFYQITGLFDNEGGFDKRLSSFQPTTVKVIKEGSNGWFLISSWLGDKWAKDGFMEYIIPTVKLTTTSGLYLQPDGLNRLAIAVPNQQLEIIEERTDGWIKVNYESKQLWVKDGVNTYSKYFYQVTGLFNNEGGFDKRLSSFQPTTVKVIKEGSNGWFLISSWLGDKWAKDGYMEYIIPTVKLTTTSGLYLQPDGLNRIAIAAPNQQLEIIEEKTDGWIKVNYETEQLWVKDGINTYRKFFTQTSGIFNGEGGLTDRIGSFTPSYVKVIKDGSDGWVLISTWLGDKWAKDGYMALPVIPQIEYINVTQLSGLYKNSDGFERSYLVEPNTKIELIESLDNGWSKVHYNNQTLWLKDGFNTYRTYFDKSTGLFQNEGGLEERVASITPGYVTVIKDGTNEWKLIQTWKGPLWAKNGVLAPPELIKAIDYLYVTQISGLYKEKGGFTKVSSISPQRVIVIENGPNDWKKINSYLGEVWIKNGYNSIQPEPFNFYITSVSGLYKTPGEFKVSLLSPQRVLVIDVAPNGWMKINTWLGPLWVKNEYK